MSNCPIYSQAGKEFRKYYKITNFIENMKYLAPLSVKKVIRCDCTSLTPLVLSAYKYKSFCDELRRNEGGGRIFFTNFLDALVSFFSDFRF